MKCEECKYLDKTERICYYMGENRCVDNEEQSEDAISRADLQKQFQEKCVGECSCCEWDSPYGCGLIDNAPSVTPKQRTGHNCNEDYADCDQFVCSECGIELQDWRRIERDEDDGEITCHDYVMKYCPNCGAKMVEPHKKRCVDCSHYDKLSLDYEEGYIPRGSAASA